MASGLVQLVRVNVLNTLFRITAYTTPTTPMKLAVNSVAASDTAAGTEDTGGSYARQTITMGVPSSANPSVTASTDAQTFTNMPAVTSVGVNIYDNNATPVRTAWGDLTANKVTAAGDTLAFAIGAVTVQV